VSIQIKRIRSEVLYKEALQLNLDHNDEIIKRRLMQKYEFLIEDLADQTDIKESELKDYWEENKDKYRSPKRISFTQHYFNPDVHDNAEQIAKTMLAQVKVGDIKSDPSHLKRQYNSQELSQIAKTFGESFSKQIQILNANEWLGPIKSGYGYHLIYINNVEDSIKLKFDEVKADVTADYKDQFIDLQQDKLYEVLEQKFEIDYRLQKYKEIL